ncbi:uroporphyrin-III C-methyltransferase/precorrin-2 dehydrogenase/sirohydrochlorin ferrochelatase [Pseudonocardia endophytica]|uniref:uroporphyrinogen-III C-methyltransferase n=2 Tax=Pseudonocardia endophytica TaxID=401976 RepID=A0A4R1HGN2_PSEEN|nr:uroporphyrin-III C-methyltransferase/precorrin-2 dehydrogenase/sirohydrochlorin ferrochelatase [Pseudonocardia endophytica]
MTSTWTVHPLMSGLILAGRRVLVIGGDVRAQRRLPGLLAADAEILLVAPQVSPAVEALAASGQLTWLPRSYDDEDLDDAWLVVVCAPGAELGARVARSADRRRIFCVAAESVDGSPSPGSVVLPPTGEYDGVSVGVLSRSPDRADSVRAALVEALRSGRVSEHDAEPVRPGVALVGGGPGDPELLTVRGSRLLARADVVVTDRLAPREVLEELGRNVEVIDASKIPYGRALPQGQINALLVEHARAGKFVVRLKGGDPFVYGRGYEEVIACTEAGVPVTVVPGVTSAIAGPAAAGVPVSHRGVAHEFVVVSAHVAPDHPDCLVDWTALGRLRGTIVLLMAVLNLAQVAETLIAAGRPADTPVTVVQDATTRIQRSVRATLSTVGRVVREQDVQPPAIVVVGPVAGLAPDVQSWKAAATNPVDEWCRRDEVTTTAPGPA